MNYVELIKSGNSIKDYKQVLAIANDKLDRIYERIDKIDGLMEKVIDYDNLIYYLKRDNMYDQKLADWLEKYMKFYNKEIINVWEGL